MSDIFIDNVRANIQQLREAFFELRKEPSEGHADPFAPSVKLSDVKPPFTSLIFANRGLSQTETFRQILLRQLRTSPCTPNFFKEHRVLGGADRLPHRGAERFQSTFE